MWWGMGTVLAAMLSVVLFSELKIRIVKRGRRLTVRLMYACFSVVLWPRPAKKRKRPQATAPQTAGDKRKLSAEDLRFLLRLLRRLPVFLREHLPSLSLKVRECFLRVGAKEAGKTAYLALGADALLGTAGRLCDRVFPQTEWLACGIFPDYLTPGVSFAADVEISVRGTELAAAAIWLVRRFPPLRPAAGQARPVAA